MCIRDRVYAAVIVNCPPAANNPAISNVTSCFIFMGVMPALLERLGLDAAGAELIALTRLAAKNSGRERLGAPVK